MTQWFALSNLALGEGLHDVTIYRNFAGLDVGSIRIPDETTILRFCHLMEWQKINVEERPKI